MIRPLVAALALVAVGCGGGSKKSTPPTPQAERPSAARDQYGCLLETTPAPKTDEPLSRPDSRLDPAKTYVATVNTTCGTFQITLDAKDAPITAGSFVYLASKHFYDDTIFHRIIPGFVAQGGDPRGDGSGGPGYSVVEMPPRSLRYTEGVVAMARAPKEKRGTSGSQFFVVTGDRAAGLPPDYALLGRVTSGQDVVARLGKIITDPRTDRPDNPVVIRSIRVTSGQ